MGYEWIVDTVTFGEVEIFAKSFQEALEKATKQFGPGNVKSVRSKY